jgi:hypothetical protein
MGGVGSVIAGVRSPEEILFGMATGAVVGTLNHMTHSVFFRDRKKAYDYMVSQTRSADGGRYHEVACFELEDGALVLPEKGNDVTSANVNYYNLRINSDGQRVITIKGKDYVVINVTHTHIGSYEPNTNNPLYFSPEDSQMADFMSKPIQILMDNHLFQVNKSNFLNPKMIW